MTTANTGSKTPEARGRFRLPDIPEREPDEVSQFDYITKTGNAHYLAQHLGSPDTTLVEADRWIAPDADFDKRRARYPDLMVAFDVNPAIYRENNGYLVSDHGKAPDLVLEVASESTASADLNDKRDYYEMIGVGEYWLFDPAGEYYGFTLMGYRLVDGEYAAIDIDQLPDGSFQGYSGVLNLNLKAGAEYLGWHDPATGQPIATLESEREARLREQARAEAAEARAASEREARLQERQAREAAEARVRELEERYGERPPAEQG